MIVTYFQRRPRPGDFSLERVFRDVRHAMPAEVECRVHVARFVSGGFWKRLYNILEAPLYQGRVNHVTGDTHYQIFFLSKRRTLLTIPDCASLERLHGWRREILRFFWYTLPARRAGLISVISEATKSELLRHVPVAKEKVRVIPCCVAPFYRACPGRFDRESPRLLQIGTGCNKNLLRVTEALAGIPCYLQIIGRLDADQRSALREHNIKYSASDGLSDNEMVAAYRSCHMVVFASTYEGFGLPIVEANAIGRPVVTSNILSMPEVAGDAACLVDPFSVASIRAGILRVKNDADYRDVLIANGYRNALRFSAAEVARQYLALYHELYSMIGSENK